MSSRGMIKEGDPLDELPAARLPREVERLVSFSLADLTCMSDPSENNLVRTSWSILQIAPLDFPSSRR